jgi:hypothetical protein
VGGAVEEGSSPSLDGEGGEEDGGGSSYTVVAVQQKKKLQQFVNFQPAIFVKMY